MVRFPELLIVIIVLGRWSSSIPTRPPPMPNVSDSAPNLLRLDIAVYLWWRYTIIFLRDYPAFFRFQRSSGLPS